MNLAATLELTFHKLQGKTVFQGIPISVENKAGSIRRGTDRGGNKWATKMSHDYGRIPRTKGQDGEALDVFVGPHKTASLVYVVTIMAPPDFKTEDEEKCFLGFNSASEAKKAFLANYDNPKFFGKMKTLTMAQFKRKIDEPGKLKVAA